MYELLIIGYLIIALAIIVLVLIQRGKGSDMGSSFGAGASATLFGSSGSGNFLTRTTTLLGILFFALSIILANMGSNSKSASSGEFDNIEATIPVTAEPKIELTIPNDTEKNSQSSGKNSASDIPE